MIVYPNIKRETIISPYRNGHRHLTVMTAYASPSFLHHILYEFDEIEIDMSIGMSQVDPISVWDHNQYVEMVRDTERLRVRYFMGDVPIHAKALLWDRNSVHELGFTGSSNFTWNGFVRNVEIMQETDSRRLAEFFDTAEHFIDCTDNRVLDCIPMRYSQHEDPARIDTSALFDLVGEHPHVELSFLSSGEVPARSGLNWGQRPGRNPDEAYIHIPARIHRRMPGFFPERGREFTIITDDGQSFICVVAQEGNKAIETCRDNSILGRYFRQRLGIASGSTVSRADLDSYGRSSVLLYRIDEDTYYMDFSRP